MNLGPILNAFPNKIKITFIHAITNNFLGFQKMYADQLPRSFNKPTNIQWEGTEWRVIRAQPVHSKEFTVQNKLTLYIQESSINSEDLGFSLPTMSNDLPLIAIEPVHDSFILEISDTNWQQLEFLSLTRLPSVQEEMTKIENILFPNDDTNTLTGYKKVHIRENPKKVSLSIPLNEFYKNLSICEKGSICFSGKRFIQNGFALRSGNYIYYGIAKDNVIEELCLENFESVDEEFYQLASDYKIFLADWCKAKIILIS